ncbi:MULTISPECIES: hypothetical protein [Klebsiella]|uniref:hypothetical protein n=1 Tax=Klebsiella TaxID=570 RepID=UPI0023B9BC85|nr:hypothetical protein [Klebsiella pneumoniae]
MASKNTKRVIALEKVKVKILLQDKEVTPDMMASALKLLYDDPRSQEDIADMVSRGCYSPPVHQLESKLEDSRESSERYRMMCR